MMTDSLSALGARHSMLYVPLIPAADRLLAGNCSIAHIILDLVGDTLCIKNYEGEVRLHLIENCLHGPDGISYRFKLKKGLSFHDGRELTAKDVVAQLTDVTTLAIDPSLYIASIKRTSRYGFDIQTTDKSVDLLGYLCHKAFTIRAPDPAAPAGFVFTGDMTIVSWSAQSVVLALSPKHRAEDPDEPPTELKVIKIGESGIDLFHNHPFSYIYPGHIFKERHVTQLTNIKSERMESGSSYLIALATKLDHREYIKEKLTLASYMCFSRDRSYHRVPLESFFPKKHPLYAPFQKPARFEPLPAALHITLLVQDETLSDKLLGSYHTACLNQGIHVAFTRDEREAHDGLIHSFITSFSSPAFDVMEFFSQKPLKEAIKASPKLWESWRKLVKTPSAKKQERLLSGFLRDLLVAGPFVPLFYAYFIFKSNMPLTRKNSYSVSFDLSLASKAPPKANPDLEKFKTEALASLGQAIQMFAHDVKKPFSMMYSMLSLMANVDDGEELKQLSRRYVSEVRGTMDTVTTMLSDIVEIGSDTTVHKEPHSLRALLASVFWDVFAYSDDRPVNLVYSFNHYHKINVDAPKVARVLSNIILNACQAMATLPAEPSAAAPSAAAPKAETLTFETKEILHNNQLALQLSIHNTGTFIPQDKLNAIFNLFFTQGKDKGTGLGLAICKKIVLEHGGKIWAQSQKGKGTAFLMILPVSLDQLEDTALTLPDSSAAVATMPYEHPLGQVGGNETAALPDIEAMLSRPVKILIVDDETLYLTLFSLLIASTKELKDNIELHTAKNAFQALTTTEHVAPDIIVMDIDLGKLSDDGFEVVRKIRASGSKAKICIHSNRSWQDDQHLALQAEADFFLPKPMTKANIIRLIANGLPAEPCAQPAPEPAPAREPAQEPAQEPPRPLRLAVLDDDPFVHDMLKASSTGLGWEWHSFSAAEELLAALKGGNLTDLDGVLIDYFLKADQQGPDVARQITQLRPELPTVLMTDKVDITAKDREPFAAALGKEPQALVLQLPKLLPKLLE